MLSMRNSCYRIVCEWPLKKESTLPEKETSKFI